MAGCASAPGGAPSAGQPPRAADNAALAPLPDEALGTQRLYRVRYQGAEGGGGLRLVLRLAAADRFSLAASDSFGRAVWTLALAASETTVVDHRLSEYCATGADVRVPEAALAPLPVSMLPSVLLGRLPVSSGRAAAGDELDLVDSAGRRWTARNDEDGLASWTLWDEGEPSLWWLAQGRSGGVLSHRGGSQFRWREGAVEPLAEGAELLEPPAGYSRVDCDAWSLPQLREDQSASAGDRSPE